MTAQQAIERANEMKQGNVAPDNVKLSWLTELDQIIYDEVIKRHVQEPPKDLFGYSEYLFYDEDGKLKWKPAPEYTEDNSGDDLIAEAPDDMIYVYWLMAKIDLYSQELNKYNNDMAIFDNAYQRYKNRYHRDHKPMKGARIKAGVFK